MSNENNFNNNSETEPQNNFNTDVPQDNFSQQTQDNSFWLTEDNSSQQTQDNSSQQTQDNSSQQTQDNSSQQTQGSARPYDMPQNNEMFYGTSAPTGNMNPGSANQNNTMFYGTSTNIQTPKKKKKWPVAVGVGAAIAVAAGAGAAYWFCFRTPSFETPTEAITTCMSQLNEQFSSKELGISELEDKLDTQSIRKAIQEDGMDVNMSIEFKGGSIEELSALKGTNFEFQMKNDAKNNSSQLSLGANVMGIGGGVDLYYDENTLALSSQEFLPGSYVALNKSDLLKKLETLIDEEDKKNFDSLFGQQYTQAASDLQDFTDYCIKQLPDSLVSFAKDWDVTEDTAKNSIKIGDRDYKCYTYDVTITEEVFKEFLTDYCDYLAKYDFEGNQYFTMLNKSLQQENENVADIMKDALENLPKSLNANSDKILEMTMYVSKDGKLLGIEIIEDKAGLKLHFGGENPGNEIYFTFETSDESMDYSLVNISEGNSETTTFNMVMSEDNTEIIDLNMTSTYHTNDDTFDLSMKLSGDEDTFGFPLSFTLSAEGAYKDIEKGVGFTTSYDTMKIALNADNKSYTLELSADMYYGALTEKLEKPSGTEYDLLNMTEEQGDKLLEELKQNSLLSSILSGLSGKDIVKMMDSFWDTLSDELSGYSDFDTDDFLDDDDDWTLDDDDDWMSDDDDWTLDDDDDWMLDDDDLGTSSGMYSSMDEFIASSEMQAQIKLMKDSLKHPDIISMDMRSEGNKLINSYTYNYVKTDAMTGLLENMVAENESLFMRIAKNLKTIVAIDNPVFVLEYIDANGEIIFTKEYSAN